MSTQFFHTHFTRQNFRQLRSYYKNKPQVTDERTRSRSADKKESLSTMKKAKLVREKAKSNRSQSRARSKDRDNTQGVYWAMVTEGRRSGPKREGFYSERKVRNTLVERERKPKKEEIKEDCSPPPKQEKEKKKRIVKESRSSSKKPLEKESRSSSKKGKARIPAKSPKKNSQKKVPKTGGRPKKNQLTKVPTLTMSQESQISEDDESNATYSTNPTPELKHSPYSLKDLVMSSTSTKKNVLSESKVFDESLNQTPFKTLSFGETFEERRQNYENRMLTPSKDSIVSYVKSEESDEYSLQIVIESFDEIAIKVKREEPSMGFSEDRMLIEEEDEKPEPPPPKIRNDTIVVKSEYIPDQSIYQNFWNNQVLNKEIIPDQKPNLVLDLDETMINSLITSKIQNFRNLAVDPQQPIQEFSGKNYHVKFIQRPKLLEFLERMSQHYTLWVYSFGQYDYVMSVLEMVDKEEKYIKRERVFKNEPQNKSLKQLSRLNFTEEEKDRTLIIDDFCHIWQEDGKVICSKKFIPFKNMLRKDNYSNYPVLVKRDFKQGVPIKRVRWLQHNNQLSDLKSYSESMLEGHTSSQLEALAEFLESIAETYKQEIAVNKDVTLEKLYQEARREILKGLKLMVLSGCGERQGMFEEMSDLLGAELVDAKEAEYVLVDSSLSLVAKMKLQESLEANSKIKILSIYWLLECFFLLKKVKLQDFYGNSSLKTKNSWCFIYNRCCVLNDQAKAGKKNASWYFLDCLS